MNGTGEARKNEMDVADRFEVAFFVSSHGFGHAARASAVAEALLAIRPQTSFAFYSEAPAWFFEDSLGESSVYRRCHTDGSACGVHDGHDPRIGPDHRVGIGGW